MPRARALPIDDDDDVVPDGRSVYVPMTAMDAALRDHLHRIHPPREVTDALGGEAGHRPGYLFAANASVVQLRDEIARQREQRQRQAATAWMGPGRILPAADSVEDAREQRKLWARDAWRNPPQMTAERRDAVGRTSAPSRPQNASTVISESRSDTVDTEDLRAAAERARAERHERDRSAWMKEA